MVTWTMGCCWVLRQSPRKPPAPRQPHTSQRWEFIYCPFRPHNTWSFRQDCRLGARLLESEERGCAYLCSFQTCGAFAEKNVPLFNMYWSISRYLLTPRLFRRTGSCQCLGKRSSKKDWKKMCVTNCSSVDCKWQGLLGKTGSGRVKETLWLCEDAAPVFIYVMGFSHI